MPDRSQSRRAMLQLILGEDLTMTTAEAAEAAGVSEDVARRWWRSLGFSDPEGEKAFGIADVEAVELVNLAIDTGMLDRDTVLRLSRALGQTMARLADWQASILVDQLDDDVERGKFPSRLEGAVEVAESIVPRFETLMNYAWRRHLAAAASRLETQGANEEELRSKRMTVGFADLSRFTALSNELKGSDLAIVVEQFESQATDLITMRGSRVIKILGDAVIYVSEDAEAATATALELIADIAKSEKLPDIRVGLATGEVLSRLGDVFGPPVNLAARLSQVARANRVLVDDVTAAQLGDDFETRVLPPRPVRGFGDFSPITVSKRREFLLRR